VHVRYKMPARLGGGSALFSYLRSRCVPRGSHPEGVSVCRQDRIQVWSLPYVYILIIGVGFLFTFYDIFDINVSFIQTCTQIVSHCLAGPPPGSTSLPQGFVQASDKPGVR
jgi:hypothetical protein